MNGGFICSVSTSLAAFARREVCPSLIASQIHTILSLLVCEQQFKCVQPQRKEVLDYLCTQEITNLALTTV